MLKKVAFFTTLIVGIFIILPLSAFAAEITVEIDGKVIEFDQPPINHNGRVMVPARYVGEALGWNVELTDFHGNLTVEFTNENSYGRYTSQVELFRTQIEELYDGYFVTVEVTTAAPLGSAGHRGYRDVWESESEPMVVNGRTLVGIRTLGEALHTKVDWDGDNQKVIVTSKPLPTIDENFQLAFGELPPATVTDTPTTVTEPQTPVYNPTPEPEDNGVKYYGGYSNPLNVLPARTYDELKQLGFPEPEKKGMDYSHYPNPLGVLEKDWYIWFDEDYQLYDNELEAIHLINQERINAGLNPVTFNEDLCKIARIKAIEMVDMGYFSHTSPNYGAHTEMATYFGIDCTWAGENAGYTGGGYASGIVWNWMHSEAHKAHILNPKHTEIGIGFAHGTGDRAGLGYWSLFLMY